MQTSTANSLDATAANLAQLASAVSTPFVGASAPAEPVLGQPIEFQGWRLTMRGRPGEAEAFGVPGTFKPQVPLVKFATDLTVQMVSSQAAGGAVARTRLDEETLRRLQLQKSYRAAVQFLQIAQTKLDTLVHTMRLDNKDPS